jgi:alkanesulfonate monooxygenase SsuD/methylene tetrahydromethanopterin reductase-like flavin-dependent oxidoreductase (luciferase family)
VAHPKGNEGIRDVAKWMRVGWSLNTNAGDYAQSLASPNDNRTFFNQLLDQASEADDLGYDGIFVAERHSRPESRIPTPLAFLTAAATRTHRAQLVTHVLLLPLHNPIEVAEQAVVADLASGGRLVLGVGMGFDDRYFRTFGVNINERRGRFEESLAVLALAWSGEEFNFVGEFHQFSGAHVLPVPSRPSGPPLWIGGEVTASVERAARLGEAWVVAWPVAPEKWRRLVDHYSQLCSTLGKTPLIVYSKHCFFGESREELERWFIPMWLQEMRYYFDKGRLRHPDFASSGDFTIEAARKHVIYGNADECIEGLAAAKGQGIDYVKLSMRLPKGPSMEHVNESMRAFASEVIPRLDQPINRGENTNE